MEMAFSDEIRRAIEESGVTRYRIWKDTGVPQATLSRFMSGKGGLAMDSLEKVGDYLKWKIKSRKRGKEE